MFRKFAVTAGFALLSSSFAMADQMGPNGDKFYEEAARFENACSQDPCRNPYRKILVYNQKTRANALSIPVRDGLKAVAHDQAQVWGDTILEGDYVASGRTRLDIVYAFYKKDKLVGYKIQYSEKSWFTGSCDFDGKRASLKKCSEGRIVEVSFVSPDLKTYFSDEEKYADFSLID